MDERSSTSSEADKMEEVMLPGFRFHPTDEELVGFYLKRKIQQRPLSIELIKQLDIYKYDPWDLPKLASSTGEKEWYFYCPRDRKYRNSARPNRVTGAGFWKATGTDRPIYSSEGIKCIGLKKSLVFYKGRAAKGVKTDWMMHEFRLPSLTDSSVIPPRRILDHKISFPANDSWAICRIFKKTNSAAQRALSHSWVSPLPEPHSNTTTTTTTDQFSSETTRRTCSPVQFCTTKNDIMIHNSSSTYNSNTTTFSPVDFVSYKTYHDQNPINIASGDFNISAASFLFSPPNKTSLVDNTNINAPAAMLLNTSSMLNTGDNHHHFGSKTPHDHDDQAGLDLISGISQEQCNNISNNGFSSLPLPYEVLQGNFISSILDQNGMSSIKNIHHDDHDLSVNNGTTSEDHQDQTWEAVRSQLGFPFTLPLPLPLSTAAMVDPWKPSLIWDSLSPCPTEMSTNFPASTKCYT